MLRCRYFSVSRWILAFGLSLLVIGYLYINRGRFSGKDTRSRTEVSNIAFTKDAHVFVDVRTTTSSPKNKEPIEDSTERNDAKNVGCRLPNLDPFDPRIMKFVSPVKNDINCQSAPKPATRIDENRRLTVNEDVCKEDAVSQIRYRFIKRPEGDDFNAEKGDWTVLWQKDQPVKPVSLPSEDFVQLEVTWREGTRIEVHMRAAAQEAVQQRPVVGGGLRERPEAQPMSVLVLMTDSISHNQFQRRAGRVYRYLKEDPNTVILKGETIIGDGTTAQLTGMLTGVPEADNPEARRSFADAVTVDKWPFIFPDFKKHGYATLFSEDEPTVGTFNLRLRGFRDPPTDHYGRYFWLGVGWAKKGSCVGRDKVHEMQLNYARSLYDAYPKNPKFAFVLLSELTHNSPNRIQLIDDDLMEYITSMKRLGHLNNTMLIIMSDHGSRYQEIRQSVNGKLEERLPMFSFVMPPWFAANHPDMFANLKENSEYLSAPFDVHATLSHVLSYPNLPPRDKETFGQSLFTNIDKTRGCEEAGVDFHWCPCLSYTDVDKSSEQAQDLASTVVNFINNLTSKEKALCELLTLKEISYVGRLMVHKKVRQFIGNNNRVPQFKENQQAQGDGELFEIHMRTSPNDGAYEATAKLVDGKFQVFGDISRVNAYGDQPKCIANTHTHLMKYCYCKN